MGWYEVCKLMFIEVLRLSAKMKNLQLRLMLFVLLVQGLVFGSVGGSSGGFTKWPPLKIGDRVKRGQDWQFGDQGNGTLGTVETEPGPAKWLMVRWDNGYRNSYRYGANGNYDIELVPSSPEPQAIIFGNNKLSLPGKRKTIGTLSFGDRVVRGRDWQWGNQGNDTAGTITREPDSDEWVKVKWDNGYQNVYRYGSGGKFDVQPVAWTQSDEVLASSPALKVGDRVVRGKDWKWGQQGAEMMGTVVSDVDEALWVRIKWDNGYQNKYRYGTGGGKFDIRAASEAEILADMPKLKPGDRVVRGPHWKWGNQDQNQLGTIQERIRTDLWITVKWDHGETHAYRYGADGKYDIRKATTGDVKRRAFPVLKKGDRVVRGSDWKWGNQGSGTAGTVIRELDADSEVKVRWDNGEEMYYRYGAKDQYDVRLATREDVQEASTVVPGLFIGDRVEPGSDWRGGLEGGTSRGTIVTQISPGWYTVAWDNGEKYNYRYGANGKFEIKVVREAVHFDKSSSFATKLPLSTAQETTTEFVFSGPRKRPVIITDIE